MSKLDTDQLRAMGYVEAIVCRGRTVMADVPGTGRPSEDDPTRLIDVASKAYRPGEIVWLPSNEARHLRGLGYVLDPANAEDAQVLATMFAPPPPQDGPTRLEMLKSWESQQLLFGRRDEVKTR